MINVIRSSNWMVQRLSVPFQSRNGIVHFLLILLSARQLGKKTPMDGNLKRLDSFFNILFLPLLPLLHKIPIFKDSLLRVIPS